MCYLKTWNSTLKSFTQLKLIASPDKYFRFLWNNAYGFLGTNYCIPELPPMVPLQLSLPPWLKPLVTPLPTWDDECDSFYSAFVRDNTNEEIHSRSEILINHLDQKRKDRWNEVVAGTDFTHSSRKAWNAFNRQIGRSVRMKHCPVTTNSIAYRLLKSGRFTGTNKNHTLNVKRSCTALCNAAGVVGHLMTPFSDLELSNAIKDLKTGKAQRPDNIPADFLKQSGQKCRFWLRDFFSTCLSHLSIPKIWRKATVIALPKVPTSRKSKALFLLLGYCTDTGDQWLQWQLII